MSRTCDGCTKCCEGWLSGEANGHAFFRGRPCFFLNKGCTIYDSRPVEPCRSYRCAWLAEDIFPAWMKPDLVNVIITHRKVGDKEFYTATEAGSVLDSKVLSWLIQWALNNKQNLLYFINGGENRIGDQEFLKVTL